MKSKKKDPKKKPSHSLMSCIRYTTGILWREKRTVFFVVVIYTLVKLINSFGAPFASKFAMETIVQENHVFYGVILCLLLILMATLETVTARCNRYMNGVGVDTVIGKTLFPKLIKKRMTMDYQNVEDTSSNDCYQKAIEGMYKFVDLLYQKMNLIINAGRVVIYTMIFCTLNPFMILSAGVPALICFLINRHVTSWQWKNYDKWAGLDRQLGYISSASSDFSYAKDVRLYSFSDWLTNKFKIVWEKRRAWHKKFDKRNTVWKVVLELISGVSYLSSYAIAIYMVSKGNIGAGDFVLYFTSIENYAYAVWDLADTISSLYWLRDNVNYYRDYLDIPDKCNHGAGKPLPTGECEIQLRNVSYTYPNANAPTIKNLSFTLHKGERLALVGLNGAGKSTLIKLMCGLYDPTEGEILLNGVDVREYNRDEYFTLFSTVFQDFDILPVSIAQNITGADGADYDSDNVDVSLQKAGLLDKISTLSHGRNTLLAKSVFDEATDFSGGEMQKLALAKALYKNSPVLLLDEPTAALDPISEQNMYLSYAEFSKNKASVFISHRLASTRFCDNIILIENGEIIEQGTHDELMRLCEKYTELYDIQSAYYKEADENVG